MSNDIAGKPTDDDADIGKEFVKGFQAKDSDKIDKAEKPPKKDKDADKDKENGKSKDKSRSRRHESSESDSESDSERRKRKSKKDSDKDSDRSSKKSDKDSDKSKKESSKDKDSDKPKKGDKESDKDKDSDKPKKGDKESDKDKESGKSKKTDKESEKDSDKPKKKDSDKDSDKPKKGDNDADKESGKSKKGDKESDKPKKGDKESDKESKKSDRDKESDKPKKGDKEDKSKRRRDEDSGSESDDRDSKSRSKKSKDKDSDKHSKDKSNGVAPMNTSADEKKGTKRKADEDDDADDAPAGKRVRFDNPLANCRHWTVMTVDRKVAVSATQRLPNKMFVVHKGKEHEFKDVQALIDSQSVVDHLIRMNREDRFKNFSFLSSDFVPLADRSSVMTRHFCTEVLLVKDAVKADTMHILIPAAPILSRFALTSKVPMDSVFSVKNRDADTGLPIIPDYTFFNIKGLGVDENADTETVASMFHDSIRNFR